MTDNEAEYVASIDQYRAGVDEGPPPLPKLQAYLIFPNGTREKWLNGTAIYIHRAIRESFAQHYFFVGREYLPAHRIHAVEVEELDD